MPLKHATVLSVQERDRAKAIGSYRYLRTKRYRWFRERHIFAALDGAAAAMRQLKFPNPYDGRVLGGLAKVLIENDEKAVGHLRKAKVPALDEPDTRDELFALAGLLVAEDFLTNRKSAIPSETLLTSPDALLDKIDDLFEEMREAGRSMAAVDVYKDELSVSFADSIDPSVTARALVTDAVLAYERLVPETTEDDLPARVEREALSKAAFMQLSAEELVSLGVSENLDEMPNKKAVAVALAKRHADDLDEVARLVLSREHGDPEYGLVTRIIPLRSVPDLDATEQAFRALQSRFLEDRTAVFFLFGDVTRSQQGTLRIKGRIKSFTVNPDEAGGEAQLNRRTYNDDVIITLRPGEPWAEVNARRRSDLQTIKAVLRRTGEVQPAGELLKPAALSRSPYSEWDPRTLWMLEFMRRDLQAQDLKLDNVLMVNFESPRDETDEAGDDAERKPRVAAVRILGTQLADHQEACSLIADGRHLFDIEVKLRQVTDGQQGFSRLVKVRLTWANDHLVVMTGADAGEADAQLHRDLVMLVRGAATRAIAEDALLFVLRKIERRAAELAVEAEADIYGPDAESTG